MKRAIAAKLPEWVTALFRRARALRYHGEGRLCPVCGKASRRFRAVGMPPREDAQCVHCGALERHRLLWLYISRKTDLFDGKPKNMLHVAPERCLEPLLRERLKESYITADLYSRSVMVKMDITDIKYPDQSFDVIYCSHVLEHVPDDGKAMREFYRTLKNDGWAILLVPITAEKSFEDPSITTPEERLRVFGQHNHMRSYGPDYADRLRNAGFHVEVSTAGDVAKSSELLPMGLTPACGEIYYCTKKSHGG